MDDRFKEHLNFSEFKKLTMRNGVEIDAHESMVSGVDEFVLWAYPPMGWEQSCVGGRITREEAEIVYARLGAFLKGVIQ